MSPVNTSHIESLTQSVLFQKVSEICSSVNVVISEKKLLEESLYKTMDLFGASRGSIFILDEKKGTLVLKASIGVEANDQNTVKSMGEGIVGQVVKLRKPIVVEDIASDKRFGDYKAREKYNTPSFICAPLMVKDQIIGVINITDKESGHYFSESDMQLVDFLSTQIALNYRRIELYNKFKKIIKEKEVLQDEIGEKDQTAQDLRQQIEIQEKLATIGKLAGGIAHEFNNPLDGVIRYTNLSLEQAQDNEVLRGYLLEIKHGLQRMSNIIKNLLACSRSDNLPKSRVSFKDVLEHALSTVVIDIMHKEIKVEIKVDEDLPLIKDLGLERVLVNLVRNAIDASKEGGELLISAYYEKAGQLLNFEISDTGSGIASEDVNKIFEPFYTTKNIDKGCGLGLTIVGEIIKSYNGIINVKSEAQKGTTFHIQLPIEN